MTPGGEGAVTIVTGGARGIGASIATALGARGHLVVVVGRPNGTDPGTTVEGIRAARGEALATVWTRFTKTRPFWSRN